ncbi:S1/P1 nuclease [Schlesneria paludicola]|uniref:S1/P1 nuclease n=1 Tax=Schlesneria paludicola TaxID=360056 RepID=UPI000299D0FC|nr:S1/P1 nuclease [Schlesneria paludicola]
MRQIFACITIFVSASSAFAWHDGGHKTVAAIAFRQLSPVEKTAVFELLKKHPRFPEEFAAKTPSSLTDDAKIEWAFQQAAVFPDIARGYQGNLKTTFHRPLWHFINFPEFLSSDDRQALHPEASLNLSTSTPSQLADDSNVIQVIRSARSTIADTSKGESERALMLSWLFHTIGDVHQPLHSTAFFSRGLFPTGDRGGNRVSTIQKDNLHSVWDDFPGGRLSFRTVQQQAISLLAIPELQALGTQATVDLDEMKWVEESKALAMGLVYDDELLATLRIMEAAHTDIEHQPIHLSEDYLRAGDAACDKRVVQAGFRLGAILKGLVAAAH